MSAIALLFFASLQMDAALAFFLTVFLVFSDYELMNWQRRQGTR